MAERSPKKYDKSSTEIGNSMRDILESFHGILKRSKMSAEELADLTFGCDDNGKPHKSHWSLYKELNPEDNTAKLGVIDAYRLMKVSGDIEPLRLMADKLGFIIRRKDDIHPDRPSWQAEHAQDSMELGHMAQLMDAGADPALVQTAAASMAQNAEETAIQYARDYAAGKVQPRQ